MRFFIDTNVIIYTREPSDPARRNKAAEWLTELARRDIAMINLQVLNELCHVVLRKLPHIGQDELRAWVDELRPWGETLVDSDTVEGAWTVRTDFGFSWFDCLLLASAERLGCTHFLSEDLGHGVKVGALTVTHPFRTDPRDLLANH